MSREYKIIENNSRTETEAEITKLLNNGWELVGGVCSDTSMGSTYYIQALIREEK